MPKPSAVTIPPFYRVFFTWLDPIIAIWGTYMDLFTPDVVLSTHFSNPQSLLNPGMNMVLQQRGGCMLNFAFLAAVLLRYTNDIKIWKMHQTGIVIVDVAYLWSVWVVLAGQGRLAPRTWRAEDWGSVGITGFATVVRLAFLAGVGVGKKGTGGKKA